MTYSRGAYGYRGHTAASLIWRQAYDDRRRAKDAAREAEEEALAAEVTQLFTHLSERSRHQSDSFCLAAALGRRTHMLCHVCNPPCACCLTTAIL